jgi:hypothetical protein
VTHPTTDSSSPLDLQSSSPNSTPHCRHRTKQNRQCRLPILDTTTGLCFRYASLRNNEVDAGDLSAELLGEINDFTHAGKVKAFLARLLIQIVRNRIAVKRAASSPISAPKSSALSAKWITKTNSAPPEKNLLFLSTTFPAPFALLPNQSNPPCPTAFLSTRIASPLPPPIRRNENRSDDSQK